MKTNGTCRTSSGPVHKTDFLKTADYEKHTIIIEALFLVNSWSQRQYVSRAVNYSAASSLIADTLHFNTADKSLVLASLMNVTLVENQSMDAFSRSFKQLSFGAQHR